MRLRKVCRFYDHYADTCILGSSSVKQRLGWVCETLNILPDVCRRLREEPFQRYIALSPDKAPKGKYHRIWKVVENI